MSRVRPSSSSLPLRTRRREALPEASGVGARHADDSARVHEVAHAAVERHDHDHAGQDPLDDDGHVGGDVDELGDVGRREEHVDDVDDLQHRLELAVLVRGDGDALADADDAQHAHGDLTDDDDRGDPGGHPVLRHERDEGGGDEQLVGERVEELPEGGDLLAAPRDVAVELVGGRREMKTAAAARSPQGCGRPAEEEHEEHRHQQDPGDGDAVGEVELADCSRSSPVVATASTSYPRLSAHNGADEVASAHRAPRERGAAVHIGRLERDAPGGGAVRRATAALHEDVHRAWPGGRSRSGRPRGR